jgi:hypothetical protein
MPAYGVSPTIPNIPRRGSSPNNESPMLSAQYTDNSREQSFHLDSEVPTPVNPNDLDSLPISDEQKARIIERQ